MAYYSGEKEGFFFLENKKIENSRKYKNNIYSTKIIFIEKNENFSMIEK
jgi:hypothetical protein